MKKFTFLILLFLSAILIIPAACFRHQAKVDSNNPTVSTQTNNSTSTTTNESLQSKTKTVFPKNWPWRGVSMPSAWSDYKDVAYLHSIGVNFIRVQIKSPKRARRENSDPTAAFYAELEWVDKVLDECKKYDITTIIAFNYLVLDPKSKIDDNSEEFWNNKTYTDSAYSMVDIIAKRYKDRGDELSAYEVIGEPAIDAGENVKAKVPPTIENFYKSTLAIIRKYDQKRYFLLTPGPWGQFTNYYKFNGYNIQDPKLIYGAHYYLPHKYTHQGLKGLKRPVNYPGIVDGKSWDKAAIDKSMRYLKDFEAKTGNLIYIGEFQSVRWAPNTNQWVKDVVSGIESNGWSWTYFAYNPDFEFWNPFMEVSNPKDDQDKWKLKNAGRDAEIWQFMIKNYFSKNKK
jgi:hypothetical protein